MDKILKKNFVWKFFLFSTFQRKKKEKNISILLPRVFELHDCPAEKCEFGKFTLAKCKFSWGMVLEWSE